MVRLARYIIPDVRIMIILVAVSLIQPLMQNAGAHADTWPAITLVKVVSGLDKPVLVTHAHDGSGRLFIVERAGTVRISKDGSLNPEPFLDLRHRIAIAEGSEQGLLSIAFPPDYADHGFFFVDYTDRDGDTVVARYRVSDDPNAADPESEYVILTLDQPGPIHNGGQLQFGPRDGYLYVSLGDGAGVGDPYQHAQNLATMHGAILRIDVGYPLTTPTISTTTRIYLPLIAPSATATAPPYTIPPTNPFAATPDACPEIWVWGLRNPWRFSFDRTTGDLYIGDVGQDQSEEINVLPASAPGGANYGWPIMEGSHCYETDTCDTTGLTPPALAYTHGSGRCAITGGYVYRGQDPDLDGLYVYADYCAGAIWGARRESGAWRSEMLLGETGLIIAGFGEDEAGNLYVADYLRGGIYRITREE